MDYTFVPDEEKCLISEYPPELYREPFLIVGLLGGDNIPQNIKTNLFDDSIEGRKIVTFTASKEYLPLKKKPPHPPIYEFLQPDEYFIRVEWLNKVRQDRPSVMVLFETQETVFSPYNNILQEIDTIHDILSSRHTKLVLEIITCSPQILSSTDEFVSLKKRMNVDGFLLFNLNDPKQSIEVLTKTVKQLSLRHYSDMEYNYFTRAESMKFPWYSAVSYFKAAFVSENQEASFQNYKNSIKYYMKSYTSVLELLRSEEQRFYKSSNVLATKELISWIMFRLFNLLEKTAAFKEISEFFILFEKSCSTYVGVEELQCAHQKWLARQFQLIGVIYEKHKLTKTLSLFYSYASLVNYTKAYNLISTMFNGNSVKEFTKYLPPSYTPEKFYEYAIKQSFNLLFKIQVCRYVCNQK
ncbi:hypothetical protein EIN_407170 [Entamoeba invadens IP1]|uniref:Trafficking protein particle complex subunit 11 domain-containing protein n=1 Tax=Entamoeba invadens IP1 TaxID=370355 RepID=A0A0A1U1X0_ENTIV|nr:hypothetical protein EIN_407170 [Entamoeba invadens IP1]ELP85548.1 hypothetical protein EIN_407170 [Entamoeba invadens IP1]|eukprot:XP_004184894.1 hypothetical protein EIN_407170 [Entamoeba invadens IP1]